MQQLLYCLPVAHPTSYQLHCCWSVVYTPLCIADLSTYGTLCSITCESFCSWLYQRLFWYAINCTILIMILAHHRSMLSSWHYFISKLCLPQFRIHNAQQLESPVGATSARLTNFLCDKLEILSTAFHVILENIIDGLAHTVADWVNFCKNTG